MRRFLIIIHLLACSLWPSFSQEQAIPYQDSTPCNGSRELSYKHPYLEEADSLWDKRQFFKAFDSYETAVEKFSKIHNWEGLVKSRNKIALKFRMLAQWDTAISLLQENIKISVRQLGKNHPEEAFAYYWLGICYDLGGKTKESLQMQTTALAIRIKLFGEDHLDVARSYLALGEMYLFSNQGVNAESYFLKTLDIMQKLGCDSTQEAGNAYYLLASTYKNQKDLDKAFIYGVKALAIFENLGANNRRDQTNCYNLIANVSYEKKDYDEAIRYNLIAIKELKKEENLDNQQQIQLANYMNSIGRSHAKKMNHDSAFTYLSKALTIYDRFGDENKISLIYLNLGISFTDKSEFDSAFSYLSRSLNLRRRTLGEKNTDTSTSLRFMGDLYLKMNQIDSALYYYHSAVLAAAPKSYNDRNVYTNPDLPTISNNSLLLALIKKGIALKKIFIERNSTMTLDFALDCFLLSYDIVDRNRQSFEIESSKLFLTEDFYEVFEATLDACFILFNTTKNTRYMEIAFLTMEKSKSRILFESFIQLRQSQKIGIPDSLINFKNQLKSELDALKQELISEQQKDPLDSLRIGVLENHIFLNISNQETFSESLSNQYPDYGNIVNKELTGLKGIQSKLKTKHTTLIEYFWGKKTLYSITVGGERTTFHKFPIDHIQEKVNIYLMHLTTGPNFSNQLEQFRKFSENAHTLFKWLFKGIDNTTDQKLIIASDGLLRLIPFEALVMECPGVGITNYEKLIYAIHKYNISYEYSSNFWAAAEPSKKRALQALGFSHSSLNSINAATNEFSQLPGTAQEIELLKNKLDGLYFSGLEATKEHFLENAGNYDIIHLAIHGISDSASHLNNRLLFRDKNSETGSVPLYAHELYSIRLRSRLAVLSACESGIGLNYRGEGVYSISRAFSYAGCPTTIMSLWKINDKTTPIILEWFYHYITKGKDIDQSLRLAKLNYLQNNSGIKAHPSNWAAMVVLGATESLTFHSRTKLIVTIAALLLALFLFFKLKIKSRFQSKGNVFAFLRSGQHGN